MKSNVARDSEVLQDIAIPPADSGPSRATWMEHRWGQRRPCRACVSVSADGGASGFGKLANISMSGALLETALSFPLFARLAIAVLRDDGATHQLEFSAVVVRHEESGVGIEWCDPTAGSVCQALHCDIDCSHARGM